MTPGIHGLDMGEMKRSKSNSHYLFKNRTDHPRRTKFIVYQLAIIFCVVSESLGTAALSDYVDQQSLIERLDDSTHEYNHNYVGVASYNIFVGIYVATFFGAAFLFHLFWPERHEDHGVRVAWKACAVLACGFCLSSAVALTIIMATRNGLEYKHDGKAIAAVLFIWPGFCFTLAGAVIIFHSIDHVDKRGPESGHAHAVDENKQPDIEAQDFDSAASEKVTLTPPHQSSVHPADGAYDGSHDAVQPAEACEGAFMAREQRTASSPTHSHLESISITGTEGRSDTFSFLAVGRRSTAESGMSGRGLLLSLRS